MSIHLVSRGRAVPAAPPRFAGTDKTLHGADACTKWGRSPGGRVRGDWLPASLPSFHVAIEGRPSVKRTATVPAIRAQYPGASEFVDPLARGAEVAGRRSNIHESRLLAELCLQPLGHLIGDDLRKGVDETLVRSKKRQSRRAGLLARCRPDTHCPPSPSQSTGFCGSARVRQIGANGPRSARSSSRQI